MSRFFRAATLWLWGGFLYYAIELLWRGHSHPSMYIVGGLCFLFVGAINNFLPWEMGLVWQALIGAVGITLIEFASGCVINIWLGLNVWDYSDVPFNLMGQICLPFYVLWIVLAAVAVIVDDYLRHKLFGEERPRYPLF